VSGCDLRFELAGGGRVVFTERAAGNLSSVGGDGAEGAVQARERLRARIGVRRLARGFQVHGTEVSWVAAEPDLAAAPSPETPSDGLATALAGVGAMVLTADCLPVALGCDGAVAMLHAGWRGVAGGMLEQGATVLRERAGADRVEAIVGPCAGVCCYEVGPEVHRALGGAHRRGRNADLRAIAHERLLAAGVASVRDAGACTICDERFFSHRREGARAGRQGGVAWLS
jgi:YfiH family protein